MSFMSLNAAIVVVVVVVASPPPLVMDWEGAPAGAGGQEGH